MREKCVPISGYRLVDGTTVLFEDPFECPVNCEPNVIGHYMGDDKWRFAISWIDKKGKSFNLIRVAKEAPDLEISLDEDAHWE